MFSRIALVVLGGGLGVVFSLAAVVPNVLPQAEVEMVKSTTTSINRGLPQRLLLSESAKESVVISPVGYTPDGNIAVPLKADQVGWYRFGPRPGEIGRAILVGHYDNAWGLPSVFADLDELSYNQILKVEYEPGTSVRFKVLERAMFDYDDAEASRYIFDSTGEPEVVLITCAGEWLRDQKTYNKRLVVRAVRD